MKINTSQIRISKHYAWLNFTLQDDLIKSSWPYKTLEWNHYWIYRNCMRRLKKIGFTITKDPRIEKDYPSLSSRHRYGKWKDLEVEIEIYPVGFKFEFFQNVNTGDRRPGNGKYCFNKYDLMSYLLKKQFEYSVKQLTEVIQSSKIQSEINSTDTPILATDAILSRLQKNHWRNGSPVSLDDVHLTDRVSQYDINYNFVDRDKNKIVSGETKYFRDSRSGRLVRGRIFHNINNMWWMLVDKFQYRNVACFELFNPTKKDFLDRRIKKGSIPEAKQKELELLKSLSVGQLKKLINSKNKKLKTA